MATTGLFNSGAMQAMNQQKLHQEKGATATAQLSSGKAATTASVKPSDQALASQMESLNKVIAQAAVNAKNMSAVIQVATGALANIRDTLSTMDALAAQANSEDIGAKERLQIHNVMSNLRAGAETIATTTNWKGVKLLTGGAGTATVAAAVAMSATNVVSGTHANSFAAGANALSQGFISGVASAASVTSNGPAASNAFDFSVTIGDQTFKATAVTPTANGVLKLVSTTNSNNIFAMTFAADVTDIDTTAELAQVQTAFTEALKLQGGIQPAQVTSLATAANGGFTSASVSTTTDAGTYAISYAANSNSLVVQDSTGKTFSETVVAGAQTVNFDNGFSVVLGAGFALATPITQIIVDVAQGSAVTLSSQTGSLSTDTTTATFSGATMALLGSSGLKLNAISLATKADAALASTAIKDAMSTINTLYAQLGAQQANLEAIQGNLSTTSENLNAAASNYRDADIAKAITDQKLAEVMSEIANIAQGKALQQSAQLLKLAQQA
jgi:flagellin